MNIILLRNIRNLGKIGEVVSVAMGYARNYLIPNGYASFATESNLTLLKDKIETYRQKDQNIVRNAEIIKNALSSHTLSFVRQSSDDGKLYGAISIREILSSLIDTFNFSGAQIQKFGDEQADHLSYYINQSTILLKHQIKTIGDHQCFLIIHQDVEIVIPISVSNR
jgi:large subunit ribosomal protein L9